MYATLHAFYLSGQKQCLTGLGCPSQTVHGYLCDNALVKCIWKRNIEGLIFSYVYMGGRTRILTLDKPGWFTFPVFVCVGWVCGGGCVCVWVWVCVCVCNGFRKKRKKKHCVCHVRNIKYAPTPEPPNLKTPLMWSARITHFDGFIGVLTFRQKFRFSFKKGLQGTHICPSQHQFIGPIWLQCGLFHGFLFFSLSVSFIMFFYGGGGRGIIWET